ncbi:nuclear pore complex protein NUP43 [Quercus suber]|nr:nuclear pore complex protein NUP43 [Quercus suber]POE71299.1 nuclear pore complex protein nup43 [Quercus suber]
MAITATATGTALRDPPQIHRFPQTKYIDAVRWLPQLSAFDRFAVLSLFDSDSNTPSLEIHSLNPQSQTLTLTPQSTFSPPSRISSLKTSQTPTHKPLIAASTFSGSLHLLFANAVDASLESECSVPAKELHVGAVSCVDVKDGGAECVTVGEDGRVNLVGVTGSGLSCRRVFDSDGLVSYTAAKWASPVEFATGGYGFSLQWWDQRKPGGAVSQFKGNWTQGTTSGIVHSIDIHPSRKHTCLAGGSLGTVFAWDLRWQQQPIILSGIGAGDAAIPSACESEVWEVQYDCYTKSTNMGNISSSRILPAIICSEDGILAVVEQDEEPIELLAEPCAINSFDIDRENPSDMICSLEWESIAILTRP